MVLSQARGESTLADLIVGILSGMLSTFIVAMVCMPIAYVFSLGIKREYSVDFWLRSIILSQILFWVALFLDASATSYGYFKDAADVIRVVFNFLISIPATALMIRTCMRFRRSRKTPSSDLEDPKDRLDDTFNALKKAKSIAGKVGKALPK